MSSPDFEPSLGVNFVPLTPNSFLKRAAKVFRQKTAIIYGNKRYTYGQFYARSCRLAGALRSYGVRSGDCVGVMLPNIPEMLESHFGIPFAGSIICPINTRLDAAAVSFILAHASITVVIVDDEYLDIIEAAQKELSTVLTIVVVSSKDEPEGLTTHPHIDYEALLASPAPHFEPQDPRDEWKSISLNYTSGTTGNPKGVLLSHRGAYLNAVANALTFSITPYSKYLWTLPMFHCNGWTHTWAVTLQGGTHICLRNVDPKAIFQTIRRERVTHMCAAPVVLNMLIRDNQSISAFDHKISLATGGAAPPSSVIRKVEAMGFSVTHLYGMTESYGPSIYCLMPEESEDWVAEEKAEFMARQGIAHCLLEDATVVNPDTFETVPSDGKTLGEVVVRGNTIMKGYYNNSEATRAALEEGWLHTGDLGVLHPDGYIEIKDRLKDIIISGGENISSLEVEEVLYKHPSVLAAAVVAQPDDHWGETPHAFITLNRDAYGSVDELDLIKWCRSHLAPFKCPRRITFCDLPKTATGKIQKHVLREMATKTNPTSIL